MRTLLISGGSRGLGSSIVEHCLQAGFAVGTFARKRSKDIEAFKTQYPTNFSFVESDALDLAKLSAFLENFHQRYGSIDILINNAAIGQDHLLAHISSSDLTNIIRTNLEAPIQLTRLVIKKMLLQSGGGQIINISSICAIRGYEGLAAYSASKGGLDAFTRAMAREIGPRGISVNSIAPGFFESDMSSALSRDQLDVIRRRTPTGHLTTERDIIHALDSLLSSNGNMTGQTLIVDGGISC